MIIQLSSFTLTLKLPVNKDEVLAFLESYKQGQIKLNPTTIVQRKEREIGAYYREPCPVILSITSDYSSVDIVLSDEDLSTLKLQLAALQ
jgi:hypothetical protein